MITNQVTLRSFVVLCGLTGDPLRSGDSPLWFFQMSFVVLSGI